MLTCLHRNTNNILNGFHVSWSWSSVSVHSLFFSFAIKTLGFFINNESPVKSVSRGYRK